MNNRQPEKRLSEESLVPASACSCTKALLGRVRPTRTHCTRGHAISWADANGRIQSPGGGWISGPGLLAGPELRRPDASHTSKHTRVQFWPQGGTHSPAILRWSTPRVAALAGAAASKRTASSPSHLNTTFHSHTTQHSTACLLQARGRGPLGQAAAHSQRGPTLVSPGMENSSGMWYQLGLAYMCPGLSSHPCYRTPLAAAPRAARPPARARARALTCPRRPRPPPPSAPSRRRRRPRPAGAGRRAPPARRRRRRRPSSPRPCWPR
jgi:hypothetical protein